MRLRLVGVLALALLWAGQPASALPKNTKVERWASGFNFGVDMAWVKGTKKVFLTDKGGVIRVFSRGRMLKGPCARLDVNSDGERGLLGIALDPNYASNKYLYVYYTNASPLENRVARFKVRSNRCRDREVIVKGLSASSETYHNGGQLEFAGGKLFVSTGDAHNIENSQNTDSRMGKILRYNRDGSIPNDNPFGNAVWTYGHRNPFGLAHKPGTNRLYSSENGPSCDDELNLISKGRNYGWGPGYDCGTAGVGPNPKPPIIRWQEIIVPTDLGWYAGKLKALRGDLYMGDYGTGSLHRFVMNAKGTRVRADRVIHRTDSGILDVAQGPGGWLYFLTSSALFRIVPSN